MTDLLKRWAKLEPEWCRYVGPNDLVFVGPTNGVLGETVTLFRLTQPSRQSYALILAAVIAAIEERDAKAVKHNTDKRREHDLREWRYTLGGHSEDAWAEVWFGLPLTVGRSYRAESQQPAEALLAAYLKAMTALEAEHSLVPELGRK